MKCLFGLVTLSVVRSKLPQQLCTVLFTTAVTVNYSWRKTTGLKKCAPVRIQLYTLSKHSKLKIIEENISNFVMLILARFAIDSWMRIFIFSHECIKEIITFFAKKYKKSFKQKKKTYSLFFRGRCNIAIVIQWACQTRQNYFQYWYFWEAKYLK